ncbi:hypothetical protein LG296_01660 [Ureibacillus chungkukjangi]|uniref:hypothetical protein n=1 Tax=Ureibacillus chungkukjangi TaxID=1202712 RepID=UPI00384B0253
MIPIHLLDGLVERFKGELDSLALKDPNNPEIYKPINIFPQHLPQKNKSTDLSLYPYLCIRLTDVEGVSEGEPGQSRVLFIAGVFDRTEDNQGYRDALVVIQKVYESLIRNPMINKQFQLVYPIRATYQEEDSAPYYFAGLETNWEVPTPLREDVEHLI